jgi:hypothetical protein
MHQLKIKVLHNKKKFSFSRILAQINSNLLITLKYRTLLSNLYLKQIDDATFRKNYGDTLDFHR